MPAFFWAAFKPRGLRIEFPGALYDVTSRAKRPEPIFMDDTERRAVLKVVAQAMQRLDAEVLAFCLDRQLPSLCAAHAPSEPVAVDAWLWSSYLAYAGQVEAPACLDTAGLHGRLLGHAPRDAADTQSATGHFADWVQAGHVVRL